MKETEKEASLRIREIRHQMATLGWKMIANEPARK